MSNQFNARQLAWLEVYSAVSANAVKELHTLIASKLKLEDVQEPSKRRANIRKYPDFREQADVFEHVLEARDEEFEPIDWSTQATVG